jgi:cobaltochelatase CobT
MDNSTKLPVNKVREYLSKTLRAIIADKSLQIEFKDGCKNNFFVWNQNLISDKKKLVALPEIKSFFCQETRESAIINSDAKTVAQSDETLLLQNLIRNFRSSADLAACYLLFHDQENNFIKNQAQNSVTPKEKIFCDEFEKIRVIANVKNIYPGLIKNILQKIEADILSGCDNFSLILLKEIFARQILAKTADSACALEQKINKKIGRAIKNLVTKITDQGDFMAAVAKIFQMLQNKENTTEKTKTQEQLQKAQFRPKNTKNNLSNYDGQKNFTAIKKDEENLAFNQQKQSTKPNSALQKISDFKNTDSKAESEIAADKTDINQEKQEKILFKNPYKIFSSKFDEIVFPSKLISKNELELLHDQFQLRIAKLENFSKKMSLKLKRKLLSRRHAFLEYDSSRGIIDRKKLSRLIISPLTEDVWVNVKNYEYQNTALTILLDNSGSMRGSPIIMSALACEIIATILERFAIKTEIIGFTTGDWKGGRVRKIWESSGRPKNPGRLNELRHIIYKHFNQKFKKAKINLGLMLKEGILKENIDGEALLFARCRLMQQSEKRKILLVISDGTPVDDSTTLANDEDILSQHLSHVINKIEKAAQIEIVGIGIGHSTEEFYRNSITIKSLEELGDVMIEKIINLL